VMYQDTKGGSEKVVIEHCLQEIIKPRNRTVGRASRGQGVLHRAGIRARSSGFTMIELMIVLVILAIAALTVVPMMSSAASMQIRTAASMIATDLEYAKSMAISRGQRFSVVFDTANESYQIEDQAGNVIPHPVKKGFDYVIDFQNDSRLNKVNIVSADFDTTTTVKFDYLGSPHDGADNPLNSGVISLQAGGSTKTVMVEPVTGYISIGN